MAHLLPHSLPLLLSGVFHRHLGINTESTAVPASKSGSLLVNPLIVNVKAITGGAKEGTDTTAYTLGGYLLPVVLIVKTG